MPKIDRPQASSNLPSSVVDSFNSRITKPILWKGPEIDGITQSMLGKFLICKERFRLQYIEGYTKQEDFNIKMEYGNMWHICEEYFAKGADYSKPLLEYVKKLQKQFPFQQESILHWKKVCELQFPIYINYWKKQKDTLKRKPLFQEKDFNVLFTLPSGRAIRLRGKFDAVDVISNALYLQENKSKGDYDAETISKELFFYLQPNLYLVALIEMLKVGEIPAKVSKVGGVRFNIVRKPLSGGKHSITQHKGRGKAKKGAETKEQFYTRLEGILKDNSPHFFTRLKLDFSQARIEKFKHQFLVPTLEQLCLWYDWIVKNRNNPFGRGNIHHSVFPYGVFNPITEGYGSIYDTLIHDGDSKGLSRDYELFRELK